MILPRSFPSGKDPAPHSWVLKFDVIREVYPTQDTAKADLMNQLWFFAQDVQYDPEHYQDAMKGWEEAAAIGVKPSSPYWLYRIKVRDTVYTLVRLDYEGQGADAPVRGN